MLRTDGRTDGQRENSILSTKFVGGIINASFYAVKAA